MDILDGFEEITVDTEHSQINVPIMRVELSLKVSYFIKDGEMGYCGLLINGVRGNGLTGKLAAAAVKAYVGRTIYIFLSEIAGGIKLITVPALYEKEPTYDGKVDLSNMIIKTYYHSDFKKSAAQVQQEHLNALIGKKIMYDKDHLKISLLDLPRKGIEILKSYK